MQLILTNMVWFSGYHGIYGSPGLIFEKSVGYSKRDIAGYIENCYIVASWWTVYLWFGEVRGIMARGRAWWGAACAPISLFSTPTFPRLLSIFAFELLLYSRHKHHLLLSRAYCRGQYFV